MTMNDNGEDAVAQTRAVWDAKAEHWDARHGDEGNRFHQALVGPACERLLDIRPGERVLDVSCGNGVFARRLAWLGAQVVATDFSAEFLKRARARDTAETAAHIVYKQVDATSELELRALGEAAFDAIVCLMAFQDMPTIQPLLSAARQVLKPGGRFVFAVPHPAFNIAGGSKLMLEEGRDDVIEDVYAVKVTNYLHMRPTTAVGMAGEPVPHHYFHRTLTEILSRSFDLGWVMDGIEEPACGPEVNNTERPLGWLNFKHIPPIFAARLRSR